MKKTVILILAILPIFLLLTISFAGKILSLYSYISVEKVMYVNENEEELDKDLIVTINKGETYQLYVKVLPELATDKTVSFVSTNENACVVDSNGLVTGTGYGSANVNVVTKDGDKIDTIVFSVTDNFVSGVHLSTNELEMNVGEMRKISAIIEPMTALNKKISWATSDSSIAKVDQNGFITAVSCGTAEIFVITDDGKFTDLCVVTVKDGDPTLGIDFSSLDDVSKLGEGYQTISNTIDLKDVIVFNDELINFEDIKVVIESGKEYASIDENMVLTFNTNNKIISIVIYVGDLEEPEYIIKTKIIFK